MDWLAQQTIDALKKTSMSANWIAGKEHEYKDDDRLAVLRSFSNFDDKNLAIICDQLDISFDDMQATLRVLRKI